MYDNKFNDLEEVYKLLEKDELTNLTENKYKIFKAYIC